MSRTSASRLRRRRTARRRSFSFTLLSRFRTTSWAIDLPRRIDDITISPTTPPTLVQQSRDGAADSAPGLIVTITRFDWPHRSPELRMVGMMINPTTHVMKVTKRPSVQMVEGKGSWLRDEDGRTYLDFVQGWAVNCLGHAHPAMLEALSTQASRLINCSPSYYNAPMARLATLVAE